ncbi:unnamed protein product [Notodromas monacha]|uniref:Exocyst complex component Sec3 PIP2-binding N-terminal domain-containing protein n=1 Tax=Notodromas monacha TaxID=399045 RepID=A0A7R9BCQ6_9CRUS|nr:unnamed protein product [Notodromas monacha]CAG0912887.1 unnamed protein product [Notodromas monacha]
MVIAETKHVDLREAIQKQSFIGPDETIVDVAQVAHANKKKKLSYLCIVANSKSEGYLLQVKLDGAVYKKKRSWLLENIQSFDGKNLRADNLELDFTSDKPYHWLFSDALERDSFIHSAHKACRRYCRKICPKFINVPEQLLESFLGPVIGDAIVNEKDADEDMRLLNFQLTELSEREEDDLLRLLDECEASGQAGLLEAEIFYQRLQEEASRLDDASLKSMVTPTVPEGRSESEIVVDHLEAAENDVSQVLKELDDYTSIVSAVYNKVILIEEKQRMIQTKNQNSRKLMILLQRFVSQLDVDPRDLQILSEADFSASESATKLCASAENLKIALRPSLPPGMEKLAAYQEQRKKHERVKNKFSQKLQLHLRNMFTHLTSMSIEGGVVRPVEELSLAGHSAIHRLLRPYTHLSLWLKDADPPAHEDLIKEYAKSVSRLYDRDIKQFFLDARKAIGAKGRGGRWENADFSGVSGAQQLVSEGVRGLIRGAKTVSGAVSSPSQAGASMMSGITNSRPPYESQLLGLDSEQFMVGSADDVARREVFDQMLDRLLSELQPVCLAEQNFCMKFFRLGGPVSSTSMSSSISQGSLASTATLGLVGPITGSRKGSLHTLDVGDGNSGLFHGNNSSQDSKVMTQELRKLMAALFPNLSEELGNFIQFYSDKVDGFNSMVLLVGLSEHVLKAQDTGSFLSVTFGSALIQAKRSLDKFMQAQLRSLAEFKPKNARKLGILPFIRNFESLVRTSEGIYGDCPRRADLDKWYAFLVEKIFETVERLASSEKVTHSRTYTGDVARMENYWYLWSVLSQVKIAALEGERKKSKELYNEALHRYVVEHFGQPLEKLNTFFEGVLALVAGGVREEEVCFRVAYSKSELRKVVALYPPKEVHKGLENLYVGLQRKLSVEANLMQVVWRGMQEEFLNQYKAIEDLIQRCYPDSRIQLEFTVEDILKFFSEIAQKHS